MALGQWFGWIGAFVGGAIGFFIGGPLLGLTAIKGAFLGATVGFALGGIVAPTTPDIKSSDQPSDELQLPSNTIGNVISDGLGTVKVVGGQLLFYGNSRSEPQYKETIVKGKNNNIITLIGYKYYLSWGIGILAGPINTLYTILKDNQEVVWEGELDRPVDGQPLEITIEGMGKVVFFFGTGTQNPNGDVGNLISDSTLNTPYRGLCWAYFHDNCIGNYNRMPTLSFVIRKSPAFAFSDKQVIQTLDYNSMHAVWYILAYLSKLPENWLHSEDFAAVAEILYLESRGISALFSSQQSALNWLESINGHIGNIFRYGSDSKFHPKLIRDDYDPDDPFFPVVDESIVLDKPEFNRKSWIDTINEVKIQYSEIPRTACLTPTTTAFQPYQIVTDGEYLYIAGVGLISEDWFNRIEKRELNGCLRDQFDQAITVPGAFYAIAVDSNFIYVGGFKTEDGVQKAVVQKRDKTNLSSQSWEYVYETTPYLINGLILDDNNVYFSGYLYGGLLVLKGKLQKSDGVQLWIFNNTISQGYGISKDDSYIYIHKHQDATCAVEKIDPSNGNVITTRTYSGGAFYRGEIICNYLYLSGFLNAPYTMAKALVEKIIPVGDSQWQKTHGPDVANEQNEYYTAVCDGGDVYVVGRAPYSPIQTARMARHSVGDGTEVWGIDHPTATKVAITLCQLGLSIYIAGWDAIISPATFYLEGRKKLDGSLIFIVE